MVSHRPQNYISSSDIVERIQDEIKVGSAEKTVEEVSSPQKKIRLKQLEKFREGDSEEMFEDFEDGEELDLSYSKFSQITRNGNLSTRSSAKSSLAYNPRDLQAMLDINLKEKVEHRVFDSIEEGSSQQHYSFRNEPKRKPNYITSPIDGSIPRSSSASKSSFEKEYHFTNLHDSRDKDKEGNVDIHFSPKISKTPERNSAKRISSVRVSLTPAQRFGKKSVTTLSHALDNFKFTALIGRGAFADVYRGVNLKTNQVVAIKQIKLDSRQDEISLMGEIDLLKILKHPNIVKYHGFVKTSNSLNVFLEYCSGGSLRQLYKRLNHGLPESDIVRYVHQILQGLNYLHEQGVVHRDVKAANVLIADGSTIKLADFGVATKVNSQHHTVVGTPNWMAPETVLGGDGVCTQSDIWSLGATIIELFTMHPPYHDLNPMATLHAIGTEKHPPLPKCVSSLAKDFLLECFQKQPSLRVGARLLLRHKWMSFSVDIKTKLSFDKRKLYLTESQNQMNSMALEAKQKPINHYIEKDEENWENDFPEPVLLMTGEKEVGLNCLPNKEVVLSKNELLSKFCDAPEDYSFEPGSTINSSSFQDRIHHASSQSSPKKDLHLDTVEEDPFLSIEIEDVDTKEIEIQTKMELLLSKLTIRVDLCHSGSSEAAQSLIKITGRVLHLLKKYQFLHDTFIRDHGISALTELLDTAFEFPKHQKLWYNTLCILNSVFERNAPHLENFCLLGGIPLITQFRGASYDVKIRTQVLTFIKFLSNSEKTLSMFISCGGLRDLCKFIEEDFDINPEFPLVSIDCINDILTKNLLKSKSTLCRILSKYGVVFWFVVILNRLTKVPNSGFQNNVTLQRAQLSIHKIIEIIRYFGQSEARVRVKASSVDLFKLLIKAYPSLEFQHQLVVLKFFKSILEISELLKLLHAAEFLEFLVGILFKYEPPRLQYKEVLNVACPILYDCCYLNHPREVEIVRLGIVPMLKKLSRINLPFRQFILPILCELVHCTSSVRGELLKHDILSVYLSLVIDPYWQSNALEALISWSQQDPKRVKLDSPKAIECLISGFLLSQVSNLESSLDTYLKLLMLHEKYCIMMFDDTIVNNILSKLSANNKNPVVQLSLLRILKCLVEGALTICSPSELQLNLKIVGMLEKLKVREKSILADEISSEIISLLA